MPLGAEGFYVVYLQFNKELTSMEHMLSDCDCVEVVFSLLKTDTVNGMSWMLSNCQYLKHVNLGDFNTAKITNMSGMFFYCWSLTSFDLSCFDTSSVLSMEKMFICCSGLKKLNIKNFNFAKVKNMNALFMDCTEISSFVVSDNINSPENTCEFNMMFSGCGKLKGEYETVDCFDDFKKSLK